MKVLYIGGTGEISYACIHAGAGLGHANVVFNRGRSAELLPPDTRQVLGDLDNEPTYRALGGEHYDVVCQFKAYTPAHVDRDLEVFGGRCGQYVFISTASAYLKPPPEYRITEATPLGNPYWPYSQAKADMERQLLRAHAAGRLPVTIVRPSHTYRRNFPGTIVPGDEHAWRMLNGKPVIVHGDGTSLWAVTHADDFAYPFARLLGQPGALGEAFHITSEQSWRWDQIFRAIGAALGVEPRLVHVPSDTLIRYNAAWAGPLLGDKAWSVAFDNSEVRRFAPDWAPRIAMPEGMRLAAAHHRARAASYQPDPEAHALLDRIAAEQEALGR